MSLLDTKIEIDPLFETKLKIEKEDILDQQIATARQSTNCDIFTKSKCGEIFVSQEGLFLYCSFCDKKFTDLRLFSKHLHLNHQFFDLNHNGTEKTILRTIEELDEDGKVSVVNYEPPPIGNVECEIFENKQIPETNEIIRDNSDNSDYIGLNSEESGQTTLQKPKPKRKYSHTNSKISNRIGKNEKTNEPARENSKKRRNRKLPEGHWKCLFCGHVCKKGQEKLDHLKRHEGVKRFICETCGKGYNENYQLELHIKNHTGDRPCKCQFCPSTFKCNHTLKQHERTHFNYKPFKCDFCNETFKSKNTKMRHEIRHTTTFERIHECELCNKKFSSEQKVIDHQSRHKFEGKPYQCQKCPKSFQTKYNLNAHERLDHRGEYNYKCDFCEKVFIKKSMKRSHEYSHTRIGKPFPCDLCEKKYATREGLQKHKKKNHIPNLPPPEYKCEKCGENFENQSLYSEHCRRHNLEENKFVCKDCGASFDSDVKLATHHIRLHNYKDAPI